MRLFAGNLEMAAAGKIAADVFLADDLLDAIDGFKGRGVHFADGFAAIALDQCRHGQFHAREDHATVAAAGAPAESFGFEHGDVHAAFGKGESGGESAETAADDGDVNIFGKVARRLLSWRGYGFEPIVFFLNRHKRVAWRDSSIPRKANSQPR